MFNDDIHFQFQVSLNPNAGYCSWQQPGGGGGRRLVKWCRTQYLDTEGAAPSTRAGQTQIKQTSLLLPTEQSVLDREAFDIWFMKVYCFSSSFVFVHSHSIAQSKFFVCALSNIFTHSMFLSHESFSQQTNKKHNPLPCWTQCRLPLNEWGLGDHLCCPLRRCCPWPRLLSEESSCSPK